MLHASPKLYRIYAPTTHSLPSIEHARNPRGPTQAAEVAIYSIASGLRPLGRLSPKFRHVWSHDRLANQASFTMV